MNLTDKKVQAYVAADNRKGRLTDGRGLYLTITEAGSPTWRIRYRFAGSERTFTVGTYPTVTLAQARAARADLTETLRTGADPVQARRVERAHVTAAAGRTFEAVRDEWLAKNGPDWSKGYSDDTRKGLARYMSALDKLPIGEITDAMVGQLIKPLIARRILESASRVHMHTVQIFEFAVASGYCPRNPASACAALFPTMPPAKHHPAFEAFPLLGGVLSAAHGARIPRPIYVANRLIAFTALRPNVIRFAEWDEFAELDSATPTWVIPRRKMKVQSYAHDHRALLGPTIAAELREWRDITGAGGRYVFSVKGGAPISDSSLQKLYNVTLGLQGKHCSYGWRAAFSTLAKEDGGFDNTAVEIALDHVGKSEVVRAYDRGQRLPERVRLANWWDAQLAQAQRDATPVAA